MKKAKKTPVFFIATKIKDQPIQVNFYTHAGRKVKTRDVKRTKTGGSTYFFASV